MALLGVQSSAPRPNAGTESWAMGGGLGGGAHPRSPVCPGAHGRVR